MECNVIIHYKKLQYIVLKLQCMLHKTTDYTTLNHRKNYVHVKHAETTVSKLHIKPTH